MTEAAQIDPYSSFLLAIFYLVKAAGENNTLTFPVADINQQPKDGVWTFGSIYEPMTQTISIQLIEGKAELEALGAQGEVNDTERSVGNRGESNETELDALREKWLGQESFGSDGAKPTDS